MNKIKRIIAIGLATTCLIAPVVLSGTQNINASRVSQRTLHRDADYSYKTYHAQIHNFQKISNMTKKQIKHLTHRKMSRKAKRRVKSLKNDIKYYNKEIQQSKQRYRKYIWARRQLKLEAKHSRRSTKRAPKYNKHLYESGKSDARGLILPKSAPYNTRSFRAGFINGLQHKKHLSYRSASRITREMYRKLPGADMETRIDMDNTVQQV